MLFSFNYMHSYLGIPSTDLTSTHFYECPKQLCRASVFFTLHMSVDFTYPKVNSKRQNVNIAS